MTTTLTIAPPGADPITVTSTAGQAPIAKAEIIADVDRHYRRAALQAHSRAVKDQLLSEGWRVLSTLYGHREWEPGTYQLEAISATLVIENLTGG